MTERREQDPYEQKIQGIVDKIKKTFIENQQVGSPAFVAFSDQVDLHQTMIDISMAEQHLDNAKATSNMNILNQNVIDAYNAKQLVRERIQSRKPLLPGYHEFSEKADTLIMYLIKMQMTAYPHATENEARDQSVLDHLAPLRKSVYERPISGIPHVSPL